ncbi:MAG: hypothetical protein R6W96_00555 [Clostridia bacterium]
MKRFYEKYRKGLLNVAGVYASSVFLFTFFLIAPISMENTYLWISIYSVIFFAFLFSFLYRRMREAGSRENHEANRASVRPYPLKGLVYGLLGFLPFLFLELLYFLIHDPSSMEMSMRIFHIAFRCIFGPMYFIIRGLGYTWFAYLAASSVVPLIAMTGYMAGFFNVDIATIKEKKEKETEDFLK